MAVNPKAREVCSTRRKCDLLDPNNNKGETKMAGIDRMYGKYIPMLSAKARPDISEVARDGVDLSPSFTNVYRLSRRNDNPGT